MTLEICEASDFSTRIIKDLRYVAEFDSKTTESHLPALLPRRNKWNPEQTQTAPPLPTDDWSLRVPAPVKLCRASTDVYPPVRESLLPRGTLLWEGRVSGGCRESCF